MDVDRSSNKEGEEKEKEKEKKVNIDKLDEIDKEKEAKEKEEKEKEEKERKEKEEKEKKEKEEPPLEILHNPARVTAAQQKFISWEPNQRYIPIKKTLAGIVMLRDTTPEQTEKIVITKAPTVGIPGISEDEPEPPEPFTFTRYQ